MTEEVVVTQRQQLERESTIGPHQQARTDWAPQDGKRYGFLEGSSRAPLSAVHIRSRPIRFVGNADSSAWWGSLSKTCRALEVRL